MKIHLSLVHVEKKKKAVSAVALNRPPTLKGKGAKPKYVAPDISGFKIEMVTSGTTEEIIGNDFYLKRAFNNKKPGGKFSDYKIVKVQNLIELGETDWDREKPEVVEHLKEREAYVAPKVVEAAPEVPEQKFKFPPLKFSK